MSVVAADSPRRPWPFRMRLPVFAAPMFLVSGPELVVAACEAGIAGAFPTPNCRTSQELDQWMTTITERLDGVRATANGAIGPWVANRDRPPRAHRAWPSQSGVGRGAELMHHFAPDF